MAEKYHFLVLKVMIKSKIFQKARAKISLFSTENTCVRVSFLIKLQVACNFIKEEALTRVFSEGGFENVLDNAVTMMEEISLIVRRSSILNHR